MTSNPSAKKLLREHSSKRAGFNEALKILSKIDQEINPATDRALAIQGSAMVERALQTAIKTHLRKDFDLDEAARLFGFRENGPLSSFGARALMGYALGEYGTVTLNDLRTINEIRNSFAHSASPLDFDFEPLVVLCGSLQIIRNRPMIQAPETSRKQFKAAVAQIIVDLTLEMKAVGPEDDTFKITREPLP